MTRPDRRLAGSRTTPSRLVWFVALYVVGLATSTAIVYGLRALVPR
jgi:hypothetical protein